MNTASSHTDEPACAPEAFRDALAELVQIGMSVAGLIGYIAAAERSANKAAAESALAVEDRPIATSLAEAIEADQAFAAAVEARLTALARAETITRVFAQVSRSVRMSVLLAQRLERGWGRRGRVDEASADDREAMARRQVARGVAAAIAREAGPDAERAERLTEAYSERLEAADPAEETHDRPAEEIIAEICLELGFDPVRRVVVPPPLAKGAGSQGAVAAAAGDMPAGVRMETRPWWLTRDGPLARDAPDG